MGLIVLVVLIAIVVVPLLIWQVISPRSAWRIGASWKFKDPDANEPSEAAFALQRVGSVFAIVMVIVMVIWVMSLSDDISGDRPTSTSDSPRYTVPEVPSRPAAREMGSGQLVGYVYPSELTISFVFPETEGDPYRGGCQTFVNVYEHTNAIVVAVRQVLEPRLSFGPMEYVFDEDACAVPATDASVESQTLTKPLGNRPILTAAPLAPPAGFGVVYGPRVRPAPLVEIPEPGVIPAIHPVRIGPTWKPVPLLAALPSH